jgi:hypothetical protein
MEIEMVPYAPWPTSQVMIGCRHSWDVGETSAAVCLKDGECTCLKNQEVLPEDKDEEKIKHFFNQ